MDNSPSVRPSVRPPVCPVDRYLALAAAWARAADNRLTATGARAAAEGSVMPRAEVRGSTQTCPLVSARRKRLLNTNLLPIRRVIFLETFRRAAGACLPIASLPKRTLFFP